MAATLLALLIILPIIEIYLFIEIGGAIGSGWTLLLIVATAIYGMNAMRRQGLAVLAEAQMAQAAGRPPVAAAAHGLLILVGGGLLLLPGFFTDTIGILLLIGFIRLIVLEAVLGLVMPFMTKAVFTPQNRSHANPDSAQNGPENRDTGPQIIEADYRVNDDESK